MLFFIAILIVAFMVGLSDGLLYRWLRNFAVVILVLVPFHAFLTVWLSSGLGHYTALRLWKEVLLALMLTIALVITFRSLQFREAMLRNKLFKRLIMIIGGYILLHLIIGGLALAAGEVSLKALGYAFISNLRFPIFFVVCIVIGLQFKDWLAANDQRLLLWPAAIVVGFGLLQAVILPVNFLHNFGYGTHTIAPYIAVDQKSDYVRVQSTLRGPNPLGAYLVVIITALIGLLLKRQKNLKVITLLLASLAVLFATYSRSAWLGTVLSAILLVWWLATSRWRKYLMMVAGIGLVVLCVAIVILRNNDFVQNVFFHTDETSRASTSSNENRASAINGGLHDLWYEPLGRGPGTSGPASVYNTESRARISENYFLQIGQEVGLLGLGLFIAMCVYVGRMLWQVRAQHPLALVLLASLAGLTIVNLLSHAWADDTLAYIWWGFAGLTIGAYSLGATKPRKPHAKKAV
jgi:hypothetical protein